jgi:hypothetical protein
MATKQAPLDALIREATGYAVTATIRIAVEKVAEEIAKEALADPAFRTTLRGLVQRYTEETMRDLLQR